MKFFIPILLFFLVVPSHAAAPIYKWFPSNEFYFSAPFSQSIHYPGKTLRAEAWALGFRAVGNGDGVERTGGLQIQKLTVSNTALGVNGSFYLLELPVGAEYISPKIENKSLRLTAGLLADLGLSDTTLFMAPMLTTGLLYQTSTEQIPSGLTLSLYYRFASIDLDNAAGRPGTLRPAAGLKLGYIFEGFWAPKDKSTQ
jgi:hypothetical protein